MNTKELLKTNCPVTWCAGCQNFMVLETVKKVVSEIIDKEKKRREDFAIVAGIGCNSKIFDYLNLSGIYGLHGRAIPTALGIKIGNPNLTVLTFAGDGDTYAEGMEHFIHSFRYNADMNLFVFNNRAFSLTTGQSTPTSQSGYKSKSETLGNFNAPINPIKLALSSGATFVARVSATDMKHMQEVFEKAIKHKGFSFVEILETCIYFNSNKIDKLTYKFDDNKDIKRAMELSDEWNYDSMQSKIPVGIFYQKDAPTFEDKWPQLKMLKDSKKLGILSLLLRLC